MSSLEAKVTELVQSPLGCAFLMIVEQTAFDLRKVSEPQTSFQIGALASGDTEIWRADHEEVLQQVFHYGPQLGDLAQALLEEPSNAWWFEPIDISKQVWVSRDGSRPDQSLLVTPKGPPTRGARYAQKTDEPFFTLQPKG